MATLAQTVFGVHLEVSIQSLMMLSADYQQRYCCMDTFFGSSHFGSSSTSYNLETWVVVPSFVLGVTARDASQGMEHRPRWLGADHPRASPAFGELAQSWPQFSGPSSKVERSPLFKGRWRRPQQFRASPPPEVVVEAARKRVDGIEAALGALAAVGRTDGPEVQVLKDCLSRAKRSAQERPIAVQISQTESYLERARKRLTAHDAARQTLVTDIEQSEGCLERLRAAAAAADAIPRPRPPADVETQVQGLQQMVNQLQEERDALVRELHGAPLERPRVRQRLSHGHRSGVIPPMPTLIPGDFSDWMQERHGDLQEAMNVGNTGKILELTSMLSDAAEKMADMTGGVAMTS